MIRPRRWSALVVAFLVAPALQAQDKPPPDKPVSPWAIDRSLTVSPASDTVPALKYRLLPPSWELKDGNAAPIYLRLVHAQSDSSRKYWTDTPESWNQLPIDQIPLQETQKFFKTYSYILRQLEVGARRKTAEWNYTTEEPNPIGLLLPDCQTMRTYAPMLILQIRVALLHKDFEKAARHMQTGFAFSRHIAQGPTLIHSLIAFAVANKVIGTVAEFVERPDSPNLYWALTVLPRPFIDLHAGLEFEYKTVENEFPDLANLDHDRTPEQWDAVLRNLRKSLRELAKVEEPPRLPDWFPKDWSPEVPAANSPELPEARKFVARTKQLSVEKVEAMPPSQVLLLYIMGKYQEDRDEWHRAAYLPYQQARPLFDAASKRLKESTAIEGHLLARLLLPGLDRVMWRQNLFERDVAAMRIVEALRAHAAAHDGKLPEKLADVTEVPIPNDPGSDRPYEYSREGDTATLISQSPADQGPQKGIRYRVTIRKK
jgi:hypothetical protein